MEGLQAVFASISRFSKSVLPLQEQNMQFWLVLGISKAFKDAYLPFSYELFV